MTAATGRPTHATVPADLDAVLLTHLTPGKKYRLEDWCDRNGSFSIIDDGGTRLGCASARKSGFLRGRDWLLTTEPPPSDPAATIARLERRVAVLREALEDVVNPIRNLRRYAQEKTGSPQLSGEAYSIANNLSFVQSIAAAALADTEEQK